MQPWLGILIFLGAFVVLWALLAVYRKLLVPNPEVVRKLMHVGMGLLTLSLPWLFDRPWPVMVLAGICIVLLTAAKFIKPLGDVIGGVERASLGDVYFPISVAILFWAASWARTPLVHSRIILFCIPILILTLADAIAALVGITYGAHRYSGIEGEKSAEGSLAFFALAFLSTHVPLLLLTDDQQMGREKVLLISLTIGFLVMLLEGIAWRGLDNLLVPLGAFVLLLKYIGLTPSELATRFIVACGWVILVLAWKRVSSLNAAALLGAALVGYIATALGGWVWVLPPMLLFLTYNLIWPRTEVDRQHSHTMHGVLATNVPGLIWLVVGNVLAREGSSKYFWPYAATYAAHLAIIGYMRLRHVRGEMSPRRQFAVAMLKSWAVVIIPAASAIVIVIPQLWKIAAVQLLLSLAAIALALGLFVWTQPDPQNLPADAGRWWRQAIYAAGGSLVCTVAI